MCTFAKSSASIFAAKSRCAFAFGQTVVAINKNKNDFACMLHKLQTTLRLESLGYWTASNNFLLLLVHHL